MATVLITGSKELTSEVAQAVTAAGGEPVVANNEAELRTALKDLEKGSVTRYIQLPVSVEVSGDQITNRVLTFLEKGIMGRFKCASEILPYLTQDAHLTIVAGNTPLENSAPDDRAARLSLIHVLARAVRADMADISVDIAQREVGFKTIAECAVAGRSVNARKPAVDPTLSYADWRTEVLGMATTEI